MRIAEACRLELVDLADARRGRIHIRNAGSPVLLPPLVPDAAASKGARIALCRWGLK
ncbi:MAG: hypothetical protein M3463_00230 [Verrucomicrobiota bacterium]|nr:hypothetical protein [Verrucomicrobiota bacterium]